VEQNEPDAALLAEVEALRREMHRSKEVIAVLEEEKRLSELAAQEEAEELRLAQEARSREVLRVLRHKDTVIRTLTEANDSLKTRLRDAARALAAFNARKNTGTIGVEAMAALEQPFLD
jgi:hypothetical protein